MADVTYYILVGPEWVTAANALREVDHDLPDELHREAYEAMRPWVAKVKANAISIPVHGVKHTGLRARVAAAVDLHNTRQGASISVLMRNPSERNLPLYMDRPEGWNHPVFGNRNRWVRQHTGGSWFRDTLAHAHDDVQHRLHKVLEDAADRIAHAS